MNAHAVRDYVGAKAVGTGGAWRALHNDSNAIELNPAGLVGSQHFVFDYSFRRRGEFDVTQHRIAALDSKSGAVVAGASFIYEDAKPFQTSFKRNLKESNLAAATAVSSTLVLGVNGSRSQISQTPGRDRDIWSADVGLRWSPSRVLSVGVVGYNVVNPGIVEAPLALAVGVALRAGDKLTLLGDMLKDYTTPQDKDVAYMAGGEFFLFKQFFLRGGYTYDRTDPQLGGRFWTAGITWRAPRMELSYAYAAELDNRDDQSSQAQLAIFF